MAFHTSLLLHAVDPDTDSSADADTNSSAAISTFRSLSCADTFSGFSPG